MTYRSVTIGGPSQTYPGAYSANVSVCQTVCPFAAFNEKRWQSVDIVKTRPLRTAIPLVTTSEAAHFANCPSFLGVHLQISLPVAPSTAETLPQIPGKKRTPSTNSGVASMPLYDPVLNCQTNPSLPTFE